MKMLMSLIVLLVLLVQASPSVAQEARAGEGQEPPPARIPAPVVPAAVQAKQNDEIKKILNDSTLWGKDFQQLLKVLPLLAGSGEKTVLVFPRVVVGSTPFPNQPQSVRALESAHAANKMINDTKQGEAFKQSMGTRSGDILALFHATPFPEDGSQRVTLEQPGGVYLLPNSIADIRKSRGEPQRITKMRINSANEDRPEVLTYYEYAGGAITFVMHNYRKYGYLDRVILNIPAIQSALTAKPKP